MHRGRWPQVSSLYEWCLKHLIGNRLQITAGAQRGADILKGARGKFIPSKILIQPYTKIGAKSCFIGLRNPRENKSILKKDVDVQKA